MSDRGVKGRDPAGPVDAYVYTERGVYRGGEEVNVTALVRDQFGKASAVPTTLIVSRPDGVEQTRLVMNDQGLGGRALTVPLAKTAMTGTWRLWLHTDPKAPAIAERAFLVEDFVPERLDMKLSAECSRADAGRKPDDQRRRPLSLRSPRRWSWPRRRSRRQGIEQGRRRAMPVIRSARPTNS